MRRVEKSGIPGQILESEATPESEKQFDIFYLQTLESAAAGTSEAKKDAVRLLVNLVYATSNNRNLPVEALRAFIPEAPGGPLDKPEDLLVDLGTILTTDLHTNTIQACHPSFFTFLGDPKRSKDFWMEPTQLDMLMTEKCIDIMMAGLKFNVCDLENSYLLNSEVQDLEGRINQCIAKELQYSCLYWMNHLSGCTVEYLPKHSIRRKLQGLLCDVSVIYWIEVLSLLSELDEAARILQELDRKSVV